MGIANQTQFDYLFDALAQKYPGIAQSDGVTSAFQFMETPMSADWTLGSDADAFELANATSARLDGFFVPGDNFANSYHDCVLSLKPSSGADNPQYMAAAAKIADLNNDMTALASKAHDDYNLFVANNPGTQETFTQWLADPFGGADQQSKMTQLTTTINSYATTQTNVINALQGPGNPLGTAQAAVNPWAQTMNITEGSGVRSVPLVTIGGDLAGDIVKWDAYPAGQVDFDTTITGTEENTAPWKKVYTTTTSSDCWGTSVHVAVDTQRIITDTNYSLRVTAVGMNSYKINRGQWYDEDMITPQATLVDGSPYTNDTFFGYQGTLHLVPDEILVMYRPVITLTMSTQVYKQELGAYADVEVDWLDLLGFRFDFGTLASLNPVGDEETTTITFKAPDTQAAQIVGILSKVNWNGNGPSLQDVRAAHVARQAGSSAKPVAARV